MCSGHGCCHLEWEEAGVASVSQKVLLLSPHSCSCWSWDCSYIHIGNPNLRSVGNVRTWISGTVWGSGRQILPGFPGFQGPVRSQGTSHLQESGAYTDVHVCVCLYSSVLMSVCGEMIQVNSLIRSRFGTQKNGSPAFSQFGQLYLDSYRGRYKIKPKEAFNFG